MTEENLNKSTLDFSKKVWIAVSIAAFIIIAALLLKIFFSVLLLSLAGILLAIYFHAFASLLEKYLRFPSKFSVFASVFINICILAAFFWFVGLRLQTEISELAESIPKNISDSKEWVDNNPTTQKIFNYIKETGSSEQSTAAVKNFFSSTFGILSDVYIIILLAMFFTASPLLYVKGIIKLLPDAAKSKGSELLDDIHNVLKNWIKGQLFGLLFIAGLTGLGLWIIGMPLILTLALIAGLMNFIPNFGPIIALVPALLLALPQGIDKTLLIFCLYTGIQIVQSAVTDPLIQKKMTNLPPALVIFTQVAMGIISGFWGVLLAAPILAILKTTVKNLYVDSQPAASEELYVEK